MSFPLKRSQRSAKRTFLGPVGWLLGQQLLAGLKWIAIYTAYGYKLDFRDWMQGYVGEEAVQEPGAQEFWFDYIADTGDGQKATYSIAYLAHSDLYLPESDCLPGAERVSLTGGAVRLPRGQFLFVGGDTAYHIADLETLAERFCDPFNWAYDDCFGTDIKAEHVRPIYAIPANHDYYDWLDGFNRQFLKPFDPSLLKPDQIQSGPQLKLNGFEPRQTASFLSLKLPFGWRLWGLDSQEGKMDKRQLAFFRGEVRTEGGMPAKLIVATPEPSTVFGRWATAENEKAEMIETFKKLDLPLSFTQPEDGKLAGHRCRLDISGDIHHYARHWGQGRTDEPASRPNYASVVAGGGGAFLHPSHTDVGEVRQNAIYPSRAYSHSLMLRRLLNPWRIAKGGYVWLAGLAAAVVSYFAVTIPQSTWSLFRLLPDTLRPCGNACDSASAPLLGLIQVALSASNAVKFQTFSRFTADLAYAFALLAFLLFWLTQFRKLQAQIKSAPSDWRRAKLAFAIPCLLAGLPIIPFVLAPFGGVPPVFAASLIVLAYLVSAGASFTLGRKFADLLVDRAKHKWRITWPDKLIPALFGLFSVLSLCVGLWRYGHHSVALVLSDIVAVSVWLLLTVGLTLLAGLYGAHLIKDRTTKLRFWGIGLWHAVVQVFVPACLALYASFTTMAVITAIVLAVTYLMGWIGRGADDENSRLANPAGASVILTIGWMALGLLVLFVPVWDGPYAVTWLRILVAAPVLGAIYACVWFGWYLAITGSLNGHNNEAGGGAQSQRCRHLIRFRLTAQGLTAYVIGVDDPAEHIGPDGRFNRATKLRLVDVFSVNLPT